MLHLVSSFLLMLPGGVSNKADTIPPCIAHIKKETGKRLTKYEYKGQYWFSYQPLEKVVDNNSDKMTTITFYDSTCQVVARWTKGGIAGLNKISPDTVDKKKIIPLWAEKPDTVTAKTAAKTPVANTLPDSITRMALSKKINWIEESNCKEVTLYRFEKVTSGNNSSKIEFAGLYYNEQGKAIPKGSSCVTKSWWHLYNGKFNRTQFRPGYR